MKNWVKRKKERNWTDEKEKYITENNGECHKKERKKKGM